ncbi:MAG: TIGR03808 family TAT-translocated repetitive protein [Hyphomicrobiaceae bacterium]
MSPDRRLALTASLALGGLIPTLAAAAGPRRNETAAPTRAATGPELGVIPDAPGDQSRSLQAAIDKATERGVVLQLPAGRYLVRDLRLRPGSHLYGTAARTSIALAGAGHLLSGDGAHGARLDGLTLDGNGHQLAGGNRTGLVVLSGCRDIDLRDLTVLRSQANGLMLTRCSGRISDCRITAITEAGIFSIDGTGLEITNNLVQDCANNGILVWREKAGEDGTIVSANRIERMRAERGGSGEYGNGVNVYRAGNVLVTGNRIADCAYTAIRGNAASNIQMVANSCSRLGEVALYAEFGFEGALIASNIVETAAAGISVTNFNEGGRLAVVQGNLIRNLTRREHEPVDKRGEGIAVEADAIVTGNTIENAPTAGIVVGWGHYMRDCAVTSNVIRNARVGIMITRDPKAGAALIAQNLISGVREGAIRAMDKGVLVGPDLVKSGTSPSRITVQGNMAVDPAA